MPFAVQSYGPENLTDKQTGGLGTTWGDFMHFTKTLQFSAIAVLLNFFSSQSQAQQTWAAITICTVQGKNGLEAVSTGFGSGPSQDSAKSVSLTSARQDINPSSPWRCSAVRVFNRGCAYAAAGCSDQTRRCGWTIGTTEEEARSKLGAQGYAAGETEGGCAGQ